MRRHPQPGMTKCRGSCDESGCWRPALINTRLAVPVAALGRRQHAFWEPSPRNLCVHGGGGARRVSRERRVTPQSLAKEIRILQTAGGRPRRQTPSTAAFPRATVLPLLSRRSVTSRRRSWGVVPASEHSQVAVAVFFFFFF